MQILIRYMPLYLLCSAGLFFAACQGCQKSSAPEEAPTQELAHQARLVQVGRVNSKEVPLNYQAQGLIAPGNQIEVTAPAAGIISQLSVTEGQRVAAGAELVRFDNEDAKNRVEFVQAEAEEAEAAIELDQFRMENRETLLEEEEISATVFDMIERKLEYEKARAKRARSELAYLSKASKNSELVSGINGVVTKLSVVEQMRVEEGQSLMEIIQDNPLQLKLQLPEDFISAVERGQNLQVQFPNATAPQNITITDVGLAVDPLTRMFEVAATLENNEGQLRPGIEVATTYATERTLKTLVIPKNSLVFVKKVPYVFVVDQDKARRVRIQINPGQGGQETVVKKGLKEGELVIIDPDEELKDGDLIQVQTARSAS